MINISPIVVLSYWLSGIGIGMLIGLRGAKKRIIVSVIGLTMLLLGISIRVLSAF
jgi:hypothetical protein